MKPSLPTPTKVHALFLAIFVFVIGIVNAQQPENEINDSRTVNTPYELPSQLKSGSTTSILVEPVHGTAWTPEKLINDVFLGSDGCAIISNITYTGDNRAIGYFKRNPDNPAFPLEQGIILSTGRVANAIGPNDMINTSAEFSTSGDSDINKISSPHPSYDAAVLTFDFQPATSSLTFRYIFASDEYPQWACSQFNDVFGFFISGPGITPDPDGFSNGAKNIALLPDGVTPVSINNIHVDGWNDYTHSGPNSSCPDVNAEYYVAVAPGSTTIEYDGRTVVLSATIDDLSPCSSYKLKLAIADVSDRKLDSAVFLEALSFDTGSDIQFKNFNFNGVETSEVFRSCNPNTLRIERTNGDLSVAEDITYTVTGTAVFNTHHTLQGGTVTIPANQAYIDVPYSILDNPIPGGAATIIVETITGCLCDPDPVTLSKTINLFETYVIENVTPVNTISCNDNPGSITVKLNVLTTQFDFFFTYNLKDSGGNIIKTHSTQNTQHTFNDLQNGTYSVEISDNATCVNINQTNIVISEDQVEPPTLSLNVSGILTCEVTEVDLAATSNGTVEWFYDNESAGTGLSISVSVSGLYTVVATSEDDCITTENLTVEQDINPPVVTHDPIDPLCLDALPKILGPAPGKGTYSGAAVSIQGGNYLFNPSTSGNFTVTYSEAGENGCTGSTNISVTVNPLPVVTLEAFDAVCSGADPIALTGGLPAGGVYSGAGINESGIFDPIIAGAGDHIITYTFTDPVTGCTGEATQTLHVNLTPCLSVTSVDLTCNGADNGSINISVTCGEIVQLSVTGPNGFVYSSDESIQTLFENLASGKYTVEGLSAEGCVTQLEVEIKEPSAVAISLAGKKNVSTDGADDGSIEINISGGTPGYEILWNIGETEALINNLTPGTYSVVVFDANNCTASDSFEIIIDDGNGDILVDLGVTIEVNIATPDPDEVDELIFALVVRNYSKILDATGVVVENTIPAEFPFMQRLDDGTSGDFDPLTGMWEIGTLPADQYVILVYKTEMLLTRPEKSSSAVNAAQILPFDQIDPNLLNNYAEVVVTIGESTSGDDNGIESNGNMASQLALRNYRRMVESRSIKKDQRLAVMNSYSHAGMLTGNLKSAKVDPGFSTGINMLLPENGPVQTKAFISTPEDLLNITNAREIFAVDYLQENNSRRAAILAISTEPSRVYEHTKVICDRLIGAELHEVRMVEISGKPFIMSKLVHPDGYVDYSVSFIVQQANNGFVVDSRWYNDEYRILNTDDIFNFQVWGAAPQFTVELVENILENIHKSGRVRYQNALEKPSIPQVYVQSGRYTSGGLLLNLVNKAGANQITLTGNKTTYENGEREPLHVTMSIPAGELVEVFIPTGYMFDAGFAITNNKHDAADVLYYADGPWMFDYDPGNSTVTNFATFAETQDILSKTTKVERDATFAGNVRTYASMFRALAPRQAPVDLSEYDMVVFEASGKGTVEVMLAKAGIDSWAEQFRSVINLDEKSRQFSVKFRDLANKEGAREFTPEDVVSIIFNAIGNGASESSYEVNVKNLHFANSMLVRNQNATFMPAYPNPFTERTWIDFNLMDDNHVRVEIMNIMGQTIEVLLDEFTSAGAHKLEWKPANHHSGIFLMKLTVGEESYTSKLIYKN
jgi:hypothetical protein